jgi:ATP-dependent DNA ligase
VALDPLDASLEERKRILSRVADHFVKPIQPVFVFPDNVHLETADEDRRPGCEARDSKYEPGNEVHFWQKQRFSQEDKSFLGGYIPGSCGVGELLIGEFRDDGKIYFIKRLIAGLNPFKRKQICDAIQDLKTSSCPFVNLPEKTREHQHAITHEIMRQCVWLKPDQAAEIEFIQPTPHRSLRHASFRRLLPRSAVE